MPSQNAVSEAISFSSGRISISSTPTMVSISAIPRIMVLRQTRSSSGGISIMALKPTSDTERPPISVCLIMILVMPSRRMNHTAY